MKPSPVIPYVTADIIGHSFSLSLEEKKARHGAERAWSQRSLRLSWGVQKLLLEMLSIHVLAIIFTSWKISRLLFSFFTYVLVPGSYLLFEILYKPSGSFRVLDLRHGSWQRSRWLWHVLILAVHDIAKHFTLWLVAGCSRDGHRCRLFSFNNVPHSVLFPACHLNVTTKIRANLLIV